MGGYLSRGGADVLVGNAFSRNAACAHAADLQVSLSPSACVRVRKGSSDESDEALLLRKAFQCLDVLPVVIIFQHAVQPWVK